MLLKEFEFLHSTLQAEIIFIAFAHVRPLFLGHNDKALKQKSTIQQIKFNNLRNCSMIPEKVCIFNSFSYVLSEVEKSLQKGLNFSIPPKKLNHADYLISFELFYRDIGNLEVLSTEDLDLINTKTKDTALSSFPIYNNTVS